MSKIKKTENYIFGLFNFDIKNKNDLFLYKFIQKLKVKIYKINYTSCNGSYSSLHI